MYNGAQSAPDIDAASEHRSDARRSVSHGGGDDDGGDDGGGDAMVAVRRAFRAAVSKLSGSAHGRIEMAPLEN